MPSGVSDASRTVCGESLEAIEGSLLTDAASGAILVVMSGEDDTAVVFETLEMVTVVLIDCGGCLSNVRCLLSVASDMTI